MEATAGPVLRAGTSAPVAAAPESKKKGKAQPRTGSSNTPQVFLAGVVLGWLLCLSTTTTMFGVLQRRLELAWMIVTAPQPWEEHEASGMHALIDLYGIDGDFLNSPYRLREATKVIVQKANMQTLSVRTHMLAPQGVTLGGRSLRPSIPRRYKI